MKKKIRLSSHTRYMIKVSICLFGTISIFAGLMWCVIHFSKKSIEHKQYIEKGNESHVSESMMLDLNEENINKETVISLISGYSGMSEIKTRNAFEELSVEEKEFVLNDDNPMEEIAEKVEAKAEKGGYTESKSTKKIITRMYDLRNRYVSQLDALLSDAENKVNAMPEEERTTEALKAIADDAIEQARSLEGSCDAEMNSLIKALKTALEAEGRELGVASDIEKIYKEQKNIKRNELLSVYYY